MEISTVSKFMRTYIRTSEKERTEFIVPRKFGRIHGFKVHPHLFVMKWGIYPFHEAFQRWHYIQSTSTLPGFILNTTREVTSEMIKELNSKLGFMCSCLYV